MKTSELTGDALNWAVAKCEGYVVTSDGISTLLKRGGELLVLGPGSSPLNYSPQTNWAQGGPIIERERISIHHLQSGNYWLAQPQTTIKNVKPKGVYGPTPLIATMRYFVASKLGDEIEIPKELE